MTQYIEGIYNYCDRWCERCPFASRCQNYEPFFTGTRKELQERDARNKIFWQQVDGQVNEVLTFVTQKADELNVDISDIEIIQSGKKFDLFQGRAQTNEVLKVGRKYEDQVDDWFDEAAEKYGLRAETLEESSLKLPPDAPFGNITEINDMIDIIFRYQLQIYLKLSRAFFSKGKETAGEQDGNDSTGAARLVIEYIDRSLVGWKIIHDAFLEEAESVLPIMFNLASLRNRLMKEFPDVMAFSRPV